MALFSSSFKENMRKVKAILEDQPLRGVQKAVWWIEYVLRHNGTEHLRYPGADMPLYKYLMLDVILFSFIVILIIIYSVAIIIKQITNNCRKLKTD